MGKNLKGRELGVGITQRKDGRYQARYQDRYGKRKTIYSNDLKELRGNLKKEKAKDTLGLTNSADITLDEWYNVWIHTCKKNCKKTSLNAYYRAYQRLKEDLGWRKLNSLNIVIIQKTFNEMKSDPSRKMSKIVLSDMLDRAIEAELINNNPAKRIKTKLEQQIKKEKRVFSQEEQASFLKAAQGSWYYEYFAFMLETGLRVGELIGLQWEDVDFENKCLNIKHNLVFIGDLVGGDPKRRHEMHTPKTTKGYRLIPLTPKAIECLLAQKEKNKKGKKKDLRSKKDLKIVFFLQIDSPQIVIKI